MLAISVMPLFEPGQSILDLRELAAFHLDQLAADLILGGVHGGIHDVPPLLGERLKHAQVAVQGFSKRFSTKEQNVS